MSPSLSLKTNFSYYHLNGAALFARSSAQMERDFNFRAGMTEKDDRLPEYFKKEKLPPHNITFAVKDEDLDQVHNW